MPKAQIGSGFPSFCWHCNRRLQRAKGKGQGLFYFELVKDPLGHTHRVHQHCKSEALAEGAKHV